MLLFKFCLVLAIAAALSRHVRKDEDYLDLLDEYRQRQDNDYDDDDNDRKSDDDMEDKLDFLEDEYFKAVSDFQKEKKDPKAQYPTATPGGFENFWKTPKPYPYAATTHNYNGTHWQYTTKKPNPYWTGWYTTKGSGTGGWWTTHNHQGSLAPYTTHKPNPFWTATPYNPYPGTTMSPQEKILRHLFKTIFFALSKQGAAIKGLSDGMTVMGKHMEGMGLFGKGLKLEILGIKHRLWFVNREKDKIYRLLNSLGAQMKTMGKYGEGMQKEIQQLKNKLNM